MCYAAVGYSTSYIDPYAALRNKSGIVSQDPKESKYMFWNPLFILLVAVLILEHCTSLVMCFIMSMQLQDSFKNSNFRHASWYCNNKQRQQLLQLAKRKER